MGSLGGHMTASACLY